MLQSGMMQSHRTARPCTPVRLRNKEMAKPSVVDEAETSTHFVFAFTH